MAGPSERRAGRVPVLTREPMRQEHYPYYVQQVLAGRSVGFSSPEELSAEAAVDLEYARRLGLKSNLTLSLSVGGEPPIGALAFNTLRAERAWPDAFSPACQHCYNRRRDADVAQP